MTASIKDLEIEIIRKLTLPAGRDQSWSSWTVKLRIPETQMSADGHAQLQDTLNTLSYHVQAVVLSNFVKEGLMSQEEFNNRLSAFNNPIQDWQKNTPP